MTPRARRRFPWGAPPHATVADAAGLAVDLRDHRDGIDLDPLCACTPGLDMDCGGCESDRDPRDDCRCMTACSCAPFVLDGRPLTAPLGDLP